MLPGYQLMPTIDWLLNSDPSLRWQVMRDLTDASPADVAAERAKVAHTGFGAELLTAQDHDGRWGGGTFFPRGTGTFDTLHLLTLLGPDQKDAAVQRAIAPVHEAARWDYDDSFRFFDGEVEPCINGRVVAIGTDFGRDVSAIVERLLGEQMADGGWNCEQENGSTRGSFDTTINVLEGLLAYERARGATDEVGAARHRGEAYLLDRHLLRRASDNEIGQERWLRIGFPYSWEYDLLRALDHLRAAGSEADERTSEALDVLESKRDRDGRWPMETSYHDAMHIDLGEPVGQPSRWLTHRALRVLRWAGRER